MDEVQLPAHVDVGEAAVKHGTKGAPYLQLRQCVHRQAQYFNREIREYIHHV